MSAAPRRIVLTRLDRIGDLLLSTPALASVRRSWPQAHVTLACSRYNAIVVERSPDVDAVVAVDPEEAPERVGAGLGCDLAIALAPRASDFALVRATRAPRRIGWTYRRRYLARASARWFLTDLLVSEADPALSERRTDLVLRHEVEQVLALVERAGGAASARELVLPVDAADRAAVAHVPAGAIVLHAAPRWLRDGSTLASLIALLAALRAFGRPVVLTYGADAREAAAAVARAAVADAVVGDLAFGEWAALFERSALVVTVDTGATHVASAVKTPTIVLFESRYFRLCSQEWSPWRVPARCLRKPLGESEAELAASRAEILAAAAELLATVGESATARGSKRASRSDRA